MNVEVDRLPYEGEVRPANARPAPSLFPWLLAVLIAAGIAGAVFYYMRYVREEPVLAPLPRAPVQAEPAPSTAAAPPEAAIQHPLPEAAAEPLPALEDSDPVARAELASLFGAEPAGKLLQPADIVRRFVASVDSLARPNISSKLLPFMPVGGTPVVTTDGTRMFLSADNARRYTPYVRMVEGIDAKKAVATYVRFYPLLQAQYRVLGYPTAYFNDRLVAAIDDLLAAPDVKAPIEVVQPRVLYQYADPSLESRSAGQKMMMRMGSNNAAMVKAKLREIRAEIVRAAPGKGSAPR